MNWIQPTFHVQIDCDISKNLNQKLKSKPNNCGLCAGICDVVTVCCTSSTTLFNTNSLWKWSNCRNLCHLRNRAAQRQSVRSSRSETTDFTFDEGDVIADGDQRSTLIRRDVTFSEWIKFGPTFYLCNCITR